MFDKTKKVIKHFIQSINNDKCYKDKNSKGWVEEGKPCNGVVGGDRYSGYLCYGCIDCKHYNK